jgi:hypothetical protein
LPATWLGLPKSAERSINGGGAVVAVLAKHDVDTQVANMMVASNNLRMQISLRDEVIRETHSNQRQSLAGYFQQRANDHCTTRSSAHT